MTCFFCKTNSCSCKKSLDVFISELQQLEARIQRPKTQDLLGFLPQNTFARLMYVFLGGYDNAIPAIVGACTTTHILFHYLAPRLIGRYVLAYSSLQNDDWLMPGMGDFITTVLWSILILFAIDEKIIEQKTTVAITKSANEQRKKFFDGITESLNNTELDKQVKKDALIALRAINKDYSITETDDHFTINYATSNKRSFWERYNHLSPSIYYKTYDYLCNKVRQTFDQSKSSFKLK